MTLPDGSYAYQFLSGEEAVPISALFEFSTSGGSGPFQNTRVQDLGIAGK